MNTNAQICLLDDNMLDLVSGGVGLSVAPVHVAADASVKANAGLSLGEGGLSLNLDAAVKVVASLGLGALLR